MAFARVAHNIAERLLQEVVAANGTTNCTAPTPPPAPPLKEQHIVMFLGMFAMMIAWFDLRKSLEVMKNEALAKKLTIMFLAAFVFYFIEWVLTLGTVIQAICPGALWYVEDIYK